jgi:hypothetical protein
MSPDEPQLGFQCPECGKFSVITNYDSTIFLSKKDVYKLKCLSCHWCYILTAEANKRTPDRKASSLQSSAWSFHQPHSPDINTFYYHEKSWITLYCISAFCVGRYVAVWQQAKPAATFVVLTLDAVSLELKARTHAWLAEIWAKIQVVWFAYDGDMLSIIWDQCISKWAKS